MAWGADTAPQTKGKPSEPPPIIRVTTRDPPIRVQAIDPTWTYGSWRATDKGDFTIASTQNASQSAFGAICGKDCFWFVNFKKDCVAGEDYPAMINSPWGSHAIKLTCYHLQDTRLLTFIMDDGSIDMLVKGGEVGFAFPLDGGKFGVSRFPLGGGAEAVKKAMEVIAEKQNRNQEGLRDFAI